MIISHKHKFIFVKTIKTAGTSMEIALSKVCGPDDIITPISPVDEAYRAELGFRTKQNFYIPFKKYSKKDILLALIRRQRIEFYNHMSAIQIRKYIDRDIWDNYFKFTLERNPFDKFISWYYWWRGDEKYPTITDFMNSAIATRVAGFELYSEHSRIIVDKVYKFEELDAAISDLNARLELEVPIELPPKKAKGNIRKDKRHYRDILSDDERQWIQKVFARELAFFDYEF